LPVEKKSRRFVDLQHPCEATNDAIK